MRKTAVVTGGAGGIGQAICRKLSDEGYYIIINYFNSKEKAVRLAEEIDGRAVKFDVSDICSVKNNLTEQQVNEFLRLSKIRLENLDYQVYFTGAKYTYKGEINKVEDNQLMVAIKE